MVRHTAAVLAGALFSVASVWATPLDECWQGATTHVDVDPCLKEKLADAEADMAKAIAAVRAEMRSLDEITGRPTAVASLDTAQERFLAFRTSNCQWYSDSMGSGTGSGNALQDCLVRMTRERAAELRGAVPAPRR